MVADQIVNTRADQIGVSALQVVVVRVVNECPLVRRFYRSTHQNCASASEKTTVAQSKINDTRASMSIST